MGCNFFGGNNTWIIILIIILVFSGDCGCNNNCVTERSCGCGC